MASYQSLNVEAEELPQPQQQQQQPDPHPPTTVTLKPHVVLTIYWTVFLLTWCFYGFSIYQSFAPEEARLFSRAGATGEYQSRRELEAAADDVATTDGTDTADCSYEDRAFAGASHAGVGAIIGTGAVTLGFLALGLTFAGPIAGGLFAANMGAGLASGSAMAIAQSAAMTGVAYATGAAVGAAAGAGIGVGNAC
jgi:hypothetical protein